MIKSILQFRVDNTKYGSNMYIVPGQYGSMLLESATSRVACRFQVEKKKKSNATSKKNTEGEIELEGGEGGGGWDGAGETLKPRGKMGKRKVK